MSLISVEIKKRETLDDYIANPVKPLEQPRLECWEGKSEGTIACGGCIWSFRNTKSNSAQPPCLTRWKYYYHANGRLRTDNNRHALKRKPQKNPPNRI